MDREIHHLSPEEGRREVAPAHSPKMPGRQGSPGWEGQKGRPEESERPKLSRKTEKGRKEEEDRRQENGAHRRRCHPRARIPELPIHSIGSWGPGVGSRRDPPQLHKGSRTFGVAAGGCPALPSCEGGVRASCPRVRVWAVWSLARLPCGWQG